MSHLFLSIKKDHSYRGSIEVQAVLPSRSRHTFLFYSIQRCREVLITTLIGYALNQSNLWFVLPQRNSECMVVPDSWTEFLRLVFQITCSTMSHSESLVRDLFIRINVPNVLEPSTFWTYFGHLYSDVSFERKAWASTDTHVLSRMTVNDCRCQSHFAMTCDIWSDKYRHGSFICSTVHFVDSSFQLIKYSLKTEPFHDSHTGEAITQHLSNRRKAWP